MSYIDDNLMHNEKVIFRTKPHWVLFSNTFIWLCLLLVIITVGAESQFGQLKIHDYSLYHVAAMLSLLCVVGSAILSYIQLISSEFGITNKRVLIKMGLIRRVSLEVLLDKIESITVVQSVFGRLFGYGTIIISGTGGSRDAYRNLPNPLHFRKLVQEQVEKYEESHS